MNDIRESNAEVTKTDQADRQTDCAINGSYSSLLTTESFVCCLRDLMKFIENCND